MNGLSLSSNGKKKKKSGRNVTRDRKRLSMSAAADNNHSLLLDGFKKGAKQNSNQDGSPDHELASGSHAHLFSTYATRTKTGLVPFNPNKVNQDRAIVVPQVAHSDKHGGRGAALFGVFDGHGMLGHDVSSYLLRKMPQWFSKNPKWTKDPKDALSRCFFWLTKELARSDVNCTFSGTTAVVTLFDEHKMYTANCGDSRAVLAREEQGKLKAIGLSFDQKPDNAKEKERIEAKNGRVEPCKGPMGEFIGPHRVWLKNQDMPGLAMSRSFGDDVATSVGVISEPEVIITPRSPNDKFMVVASDGVWEFLSNQDVVDIVSKFEDPKKAAKAVVKESVRKWQSEEDVIDDITIVVTYL